MTGTFMRTRRALVIGVLSVVGVSGCAGRGGFDGSVATQRPTVHRVLVRYDAVELQSELNKAAADGFRLQAVHRTITTLASDEAPQRTVAVAGVTVARNSAPGRFSYRVVATSLPDSPLTTNDDSIDRLVSALTEVFHGSIRVATEEGFHYPGQALVLTGEADYEDYVHVDGVLVVLERDNEAKDGSGAGTPLSTVRVLATVRAQTMEREMNEAAEAGCRLQAVEADFEAVGAVRETVAILACDDVPRRFDYRVFRGGLVRLLRLDPLDIETSAEETEQALDEAAAEGFVYRAHTGGSEPFMVFMERDRDALDDDVSVRHLVLAVDRGTVKLEDALVEASTYGYTVLGIGRRPNGGASTISAASP